MIVVKVTYAVNEAYISTNKEMIAKFLRDFEKLDNMKFRYTILQPEDPKTFIHLSQYKDKAIQEELLATVSFQKFQEERDKNLVSKPEIEFLNYIGSAADAFSL